MKNRIVFGTIKDSAGAALTCLITKTKRYPFDVSRPESRQAAEDQLAAEQGPLIARLDAKNGRELTRQELIHGVSHKELRSPQELELIRLRRTAEAAQNKPFTGNPFAAALEAERAKQPETKLQQLERKSREWEAEQAAKAAAEAKRNQPRRIAARKAISEAQFEARYDPNVSQESMEFLNRLASMVEEDDDLSAFREGFNSYRQAQDNELAERLQSFDAEIRQLRAARQQVASGFYEPETEVNGPDATPEQLEAYRQYKEGLERTREIEEQRAVKRAS